MVMSHHLIKSLGIPVILTLLFSHSVLADGLTEGTKSKVKEKKASRTPASVIPKPTSPLDPKAKDQQINSMLNQVKNMPGLPSLKPLGSIDHK